jgi:hypothetical protein
MAPVDGQSAAGRRSGTINGASLGIFVNWWIRSTHTILFSRLHASHTVQYKSVFKDNPYDSASPTSSACITTHEIIPCQIQLADPASNTTSLPILQALQNTRPRVEERAYVGEPGEQATRRARKPSYTAQPCQSSRGDTPTIQSQHCCGTPCAHSGSRGPRSLSQTHLPSGNTGLP